MPSELPTRTFMRRMLDTVIGLLAGTLLGGIVAGVSLALVRALIPSVEVLFIVAGVLGGGIYGALYGMLHGAFVGSIWRLVGRSNTNSPKRFGRRTAIHLVCLGTMTSLAIFLWATEAVHVPPPSDVESMTARFYFQKGKPNKFPVSPKHVPTVLNALRPATRDWLPAKWVVLGQLEITCKNGTKMTIDLYQTHEATGAFSVHPDNRPRNSEWISNYFRGGTDEGIAMAIENAYQNSQEE